MDTIDVKLIEEAAQVLLAKAACNYPKVYLERLLAMRREETHAGARGVLEAILANILAAARQKVSLCQDTGIPTLHVYLNPGVTLAGDLEEALGRAVARASASVPLRSNVVHPLTLANSGNNLGWGAPFIHYHHASPPGPLRLRAELKGFGGEIKSSSDWIYTSSPDPAQAMLAYVLNNLLLARGEACPPGVIGVGLGGYGGDAASRAKQAVFRQMHSNGQGDSQTRGLEQHLLACLNRLGLGPMGGGGRTTSLAVNLEARGTHTAAISIAVCQQCWACRASEALIDSQGARYVTSHLEEADLIALERELAQPTPAAGSDQTRTWRLELPLKPQEIASLRVGDLVYLSGALPTARDRAHGRMAELARQGRVGEIPASIRNSGAVYHCGPVVRPQGDGWRVCAAGPTTSSRFSADAAYLVGQGVFQVAVGKGTMSSAMVEALRGRGVHLRAVGGCAVTYQSAINQVGVDWLDLGPPEAVWSLGVSELGPLVVGIDSQGNSLSRQVMEQALANAEALYQELGMDPGQRYLQYPQTLAGHSLAEVRAHLLAKD